MCAPPEYLRDLRDLGPWGWCNLGTQTAEAMSALAADRMRSGVEILMIRAGDSENYPQPSQSVAIHYDAYLPGSAKPWDSSKKRDRPLRFRLSAGQVIPGLDEGVSQLR